MFELIVAGVAVSAIASACVTSVVSWWNARKRYHLSPIPFHHPLEQKYQTAIEAPKAPIPKEIRDEMEQTTDWWDRQYHAALEKSGAKVIARIVGESYDEYTFGGKHVFHHTEPDRKALAGCECRECLAVMRGSSAESVGTELELWREHG